MSKNQPKTMRFSSDVEEYIENFQGNNFTEKFHNLVRFCRDEEKNKTDRLHFLDKQINEKRIIIESIDKYIYGTQKIELEIKKLTKEINNTKSQYKNFRENILAKDCAKSYDTRCPDLKCDQCP